MYSAIVILTVLGLFFGTTGCAVNQIMRDCNKVEKSEAGYVCKTTNPWDDL